MKIKIWFIAIAWIVITVVWFSNVKAEKYRIMSFDMTFENPPAEVITLIKQFQMVVTDLKQYAIKASAMDEDSKQATIHICHNDVQQPCTENLEIDKIDIDKTITDKEIKPITTPTPEPK